MMMKIFNIFVISLFSCVSLIAGTPVESLMQRFDDVKGVKNVTVGGSMMAFARPVLKKYPVAPLADDVTEVSVMKIGKASDAEKKRFLEEFSSTMKEYVYCGKTGTPDGIVDVYVHMLSDETVDELVVYNPERYILNSLTGTFPVRELQKIADRK